MAFDNDSADEPTATARGLRGAATSLRLLVPVVAVVLVVEAVTFWPELCAASPDRLVAYAAVALLLTVWVAVMVGVVGFVSRAVFPDPPVAARRPSAGEPARAGVGRAVGESAFFAVPAAALAGWMTRLELRSDGAGLLIAVFILGIWLGSAASAARAWGARRGRREADDGRSDAVPAANRPSSGGSVPAADPAPSPDGRVPPTFRPRTTAGSRPEGKGPGAGVVLGGLIALMYPVMWCSFQPDLDQEPVIVASRAVLPLAAIGVALYIVLRKAWGQ